MNIRMDRDWKGRDEYEKNKQKESQKEEKNPFGDRWDNHPDAAKIKKK